MLAESISAVSMVQLSDMEHYFIICLRYDKPGLGAAMMRVEEADDDEACTAKMCQIALIIVLKLVVKSGCAMASVEEQVLLD